MLNSSTLFGFDKNPKVSHIEFSRNISNIGRDIENGDGDNYNSDEELSVSGVNRNGLDGPPPTTPRTTVVTRRRTRFRMNSSNNSQQQEDEDNQGKNTYFDVTKIALFSRVVVLILQIFCRAFLSPHINDGFKTTHLEGNFLDHVVNLTLGGFTNWDGEYFIHIATQGYTHVNTMAFFPLFPIIIGNVSYVLNIFPLRFISIHSIILVLGWLLNTYLFVETAKTLQRIVKYMDHGMTNLISSVTLLFCFNPASIFFSAFYSESLFSYLTFNVLLSLYERKLENAVLYTGLGAVCRSNGLLNFGFIGAFVVRDAICKKRRLNVGILDPIYEITRAYLISILGFFPFFYFQVFCLWKFCDKVLKSKEDFLPFCELEMLPYSYVQETNWNVGFMSYFEIKQIPNFLLATPVLFITINLAYKRAGFYVKSIIIGTRIESLPDLAMSCHALFIVFFCFFYTHVQISTRMILSSCPYLYIYIAKTIRSEIFKFRDHQIEWPIYSFTIHTWCVSYFIIGTISFSLGYPWT